MSVLYHIHIPFFNCFYPIYGSFAAVFFRCADLLLFHFSPAAVCSFCRTQLPCRNNAVPYQWWNRRIPVNAITISYLSQHSITASSRTEPPGWAIYFTPLLWALSILSENGKNASEPRVTSCIPSSHALFSSLVNTGGFTLKTFSQAPSASTSIYSSPM